MSRGASLRTFLAAAVLALAVAGPAASQRIGRGGNVEPPIAVPGPLGASGAGRVPLTSLPLTGTPATTAPTVAPSHLPELDPRFQAPHAAGDSSTEGAATASESPPDSNSSESPPPSEAAPPDPPQPSAADIWRGSFAFVVDYAPGVTLGAASEFQANLARETLDTWLTRPPALLILLHPDADLSDITRIRAAAPQGADIEVLATAGNVSQQVQDALGRLKDRVVLVVGHITGDGDRQFTVEDQYGTSNSVALADVTKAGDDNNVRLFMVGCQSAGPDQSGTFRDIDTAEVASAIPAALSAQTLGDVFAALGAVFAIGIDAYGILDGDLRAARIDGDAQAQAPVPAPILVRLPPPERFRAFTAIVPAGCDAFQDKAECEDARTRITAALPSLLQYWPWAAGGLVALFIFWPRRRYR